MAKRRCLAERKNNNNNNNRTELEFLYHLEILFLIQWLTKFVLGMLRRTDLRRIVYVLTPFIVYKPHAKLI